MISTGIYDSSVAWTLGQKNPGFMGLAAQRILEVLIFLADDYGRGRYIPGMIRIRAFSSIPEILDEITDADVETWLQQIESEGSVSTYEIDGQKYYTLTGWRYYQRGNWRPRPSNIPPPPWEEGESPPDDRDVTKPDKSTIKSQKKSQKKSAVEVDEEVVAEKKRREGENCRKRSGAARKSTGTKTPHCNVKTMLKDPKVPDSEAVSANCVNLPDPDPYPEHRLRQTEQNDHATPEHPDEEQDP